MRIGLIIPVAILYRIFGNAEISYYSVPLVSMAVFSISIYLIGCRLFNRRVGLIAALWTIFIPSLMLESGHLLPDVPATACLTTGFALIMCIKKTGKNRKISFTERKRQWLFFLAGILFGWSYLTKEYMAVLFLLTPLIFWTLDIPYRHLISIITGMVLMFGFELIIGYIYYQNPLIRFITASPRETWGNIEMDVSRIVSFLPVLLKRYGGEGTTIISVIAVISFVFQGIKKDKRYIFLFLWAMIFYSFFTVVGLLPVIFSWKDIVLIRLHKFRYWIPILPPLIIGGVAAVDNYLGKLLQKLKKKQPKNDILVFMIMAALCTATGIRGVLSIRDHPDLIRSGADHYLELRAYLKENSNPKDVIWIDRDNNRAFERILPMYTHDFWGSLVWEGGFKYLNTNGQYLRSEEINEGMVIVDRDFYNAKLYEIPEYLDEIPKNWKILFESENHMIALYSVE